MDFLYERNFVETCITQNQYVGTALATSTRYCSSSFEGFVGLGIVFVCLFGSAFVIAKIIQG